MVSAPSVLHMPPTLISITRELHIWKEEKERDIGIKHNYYEFLLFKSPIIACLFRQQVTKNSNCAVFKTV